MPTINLDKLDASLERDLQQQVQDGLITQDEADRLRAMIRGREKKEGGK